MPKVLIVDDNEDMLDTLDHLFRFYDFTVLKAENGKVGVEKALREEPDVIILDALMPVLNGFEACKILKENPKTKEIPVIFLSANYVEDEHRIMGIELGADDYILKPFNAKELIARVKSTLHKKDLVESLRQNNRSLIREKSDALKKIENLQKKAVELEGAQITDSLTGLYNRTFFQKRFHEELSRAKRYKDHLSLVIIDVDLFRTVNEVFGEKTGDYILMRMANVILNNTRTTDVVFRFEGNCFMIILPKTDESGAFYEAERIRSAVAQTSFFDQDFYELKKLSPKRKQDYQKLTVSVGLMEVDYSHMEKPEHYVNQVNQALQQAKSEGRNKTIRFSRMSPAS
ncbi:MAG: diguanylate cyclase [Calditrichaeota bacterium]|nr:diguanylate cyclase [Calditrichota bacterium]RQW08263.1 MAG: diguanylate cyclase [Calditrichota bacterium]